MQPSGPKTCAAHPGATRGHCTPAAALPRFGGAAKTLGAVLALTPSVRQPSTLLHAPREGCQGLGGALQPGTARARGRTQCSRNTWHGRRRHCSPRRATAACGLLPSGQDDRPWRICSLQRERGLQTQMYWKKHTLHTPSSSAEAEDSHFPSTNTSSPRTLTFSAGNLTPPHII